MPVVAQDPGVRDNGHIVIGWVDVPYEDVAAGPVGHRVHVVDYDTETRTLYRPTSLEPFDPQHRPSNAQILDRRFHGANVYALVMDTLTRFEFALGRRVGWGFDSHQLKVVPHAFRAANAFYSPDDEALLFGYFIHDGKKVFTCLSHDIVVHETTHALLDGLRSRFKAPSSPDQAGFHEGFADVVALLSVFRMTEILATLLEQAASQSRSPRRGLISKDLLEDKDHQLRSSLLFGLAEQFGSAINGARANALRRSVELAPDTKPRTTDELTY
jgi:hypothetical protein